MLAVGVASSSSARIMRPARLRTMQLDSSIAVAQFIAVAATQPRCTCGYTPPVHRHSAAKRRPSSDGPRLTALAVFRPAGAGSPWRPPHRHVCKHGKCSSALSSSLCTRHHPLMHERPRDCLAAWPPRFRVLLLRPRSQTPAFEAPARLIAGTGHHPGRQSPSPVRTSLRLIGHVAGPGNTACVSPARCVHSADHPPASAGWHVSVRPLADDFGVRI